MTNIYPQAPLLAPLSGSRKRHGDNVSMAKVTPRFKHQAGDHPGHYVRQWRRHRGYTQEQLAEMIGVTHGAISQLENGKIKYTQAMLEALADAFVTEPGAILNVDPLRSQAIWSIWERALPAQRSQIIAIAETLLKDGTNG